MPKDRTLLGGENPEFSDESEVALNLNLFCAGCFRTGIEEFGSLRT